MEEVNTRKQRSLKYIKRAVHQYKEITESKEGRILDGPFTGENCRLIKSIHGFHLEILSTERNPDIEDWFSFRVECDSKRYKLEKVLLHGRSISITQKMVTEVSKADFLEMHSEPLTEAITYYHRLMLPVDKRLIPFTQIQDESFSADNDYDYAGLVVVTREETGTRYHMYSVTENSQSYFVIDCLEKETSQDFDDFSWHCLIAYGYITGHLIQNEGVYLRYCQEEMMEADFLEFHLFRQSIKNIITPMTGNPWAFGSDKYRDYQDSMQGLMRELTKDEFCRLCNRIHSDENFAAHVLLYIEASTRSMLLKPAAYSVILEGFGEMFYDQNAKVAKPIKDTALWTVIRSGLLDKLHEYKDRLSADNAESFETILKNIDKLNQPINKDKLKLPFKMLEIPITSDDEDAIEHRNDFLHGNINLVKRKNRKAPRQNIIEISNRLATLINSIILKSIGYDSYIVNHAKVNESGAKRAINENIYRLISHDLY